jgi:transposase
MISIETWAYIRRLYFHDGLDISAIAKELTLDRKTVRSAILTDDFLRIETGPGEQAQCDWGKCGTVDIEGAIRNLSCFVMTLSHSRFMHVCFYLSETMSRSFGIDGHLRAFDAFGGIPQNIVYDNLKSVVLGRYGKTIHFNATFMDFAGYCLFKPDPCRPAKPQHKGKVERGVGFVKGNFLAGREQLLEPPFELALLNHACAKWLVEKNQRIHGTTHKRPVDLLQKEQLHLLPLPPHPYDIALPKPVHADSQAFVRFETNLYSVPAEAAGKPVVLKATPYQIDICCENSRVATHKRSFARHKVFENPEHRKKMLRQKQRARQSKEIEFFLALDPVAEKFLEGLTQAGAKISHHIRRIMQMVDIYGKTEVLSAIERTCKYGAYHFEYVENIIQQRRRATETPVHGRPLPAIAKHGHNIRLREIDMSRYRINRDKDNE